MSNRWPIRRFGHLAGAIAQWLGAPGFVQPGDYEGLGCQIRVKCSPYFTTITVKGVDYYFYRGSGGFDGTGFDPSVVKTTASERLVNQLRDTESEEQTP